MASKIWQVVIEVEDPGFPPDFLFPEHRYLTRAEILELFGFDTPDDIRVQVKELKEK